MTDTNTILLYVTDAQASGRFYAKLLGCAPIETSPTFVLFLLPTGLALGLWGKDGVQPAPRASGGGSEIGFKVKNAAAIDSTHADWQAKGATIALPPTDLDFGRSFVALDPDGHRLRVYVTPRHHERGGELIVDMQEIGDGIAAYRATCRTNMDHDLGDDIGMHVNG